jgi:hypothetical protein
MGTSNMTPSLNNPKLRVKRAKEHLDVLHVKVKEFTDTKPPHVSVHEDIQNALYVLQIKLPIIDPKLAIIAGDAIYYLRSSLDHIAWQLALLTTDRPYDLTAFPVIDDKTSKKMSKFRRITKNIPSDAVDEIDALQPYHRGASYKDDLLWKLDKLCNIDKHRVIPAEGTSLDFQIPRDVTPSLSRLNDTYTVTMPISVKTRMQFAPNPTFDIQLGSRVDGLVISIGELPDIYKYIRDIVFPKFSRFFPQLPPLFPHLYSKCILPILNGLSQPPHFCRPSPRYAKLNQ